MQQIKHVDVVIAGGGMTGAMLAYALLSQTARPLKVAIVEKQAVAAQQASVQLSSTQLTATQHSSGQLSAAPSQSFDSRSIALSAASVDLLNSWGLWSELQAHACAIKHIAVSDRGHFGKTRLNAADFLRQSLGQVIEIEKLGSLIYQRLSQFSNQQLLWFRPNEIQQIEPSKELQRLTLTSGEQLTCQLLALCEGGDSPTRALAGIGCDIETYPHSALIANIGLAEDHKHRAFERFTQHGPLALLPLNRQRFSLVWSLLPEDAIRLQSLPASAFLTELQQAFGYRAGVFNSVGERVVYPLVLKTAKEASRHRLVLCGNSLHNLHPIAGQGFNLALRDLAALVNLVTHSSDVGSYQLTQNYARLRLQDMQQVVALTDGLVRLFANDSKLCALGRNIGLSLLNNLPSLKTLFAEQTMGLAPFKRQQQALAEQFSLKQQDL